MPSIPHLTTLTLLLTPTFTLADAPWRWYLNIYTFGGCQGYNLQPGSPIYSYDQRWGNRACIPVQNAGSYWFDGNYDDDQCNCLARPMTGTDCKGKVLDFATDRGCGSGLFGSILVVCKGICCGCGDVPPNTAPPNGTDLIEGREWEA